MSTLTVTEKRSLEKLFGMRSGYVLDFSNRTFQEFILGSTGLDIDSEEVGGFRSKANRLRRLWTNQPDYIVGKLLKDLAAYVETDSPLKDECRAIANRLLSGERVTAPADQKRIWGEGGYRVFLSHKADVKKEAAQLKERLQLFGISAFVAHADIKPTREWQDEIVSALASMQAFVALLTKNFHESDWTDQEVGYAFCRRVPFISVKLGRAPCGFIGRFQALSCAWAAAPLELCKLLIKEPGMLDALISAVPKCFSFEDGNTLSQVLSSIDILTDKQAEQLVSAFNTNTQLNGSWGFNGKKDWQHGPGLAAHLSRATGKRYKINESKSWPGFWQIELK